MTVTILRFVNFFFLTQTYNKVTGIVSVCVCNTELIWFSFTGNVYNDSVLSFFLET